MSLYDGISFSWQQANISSPRKQKTASEKYKFNIWIEQQVEY